MAPHSRDSLVFVQQQQQQQQSPEGHPDVSTHQSTPLSLDAYYGGNHSPSSFRHEGGVGLFDSPQSLPVYDEPTVPQHRKQSRKHNSLMASPYDGDGNDDDDDDEAAAVAATGTSASNSSASFLEGRQTAARRHQTWYYSSNHVLVNRERMLRGIKPMIRSVQLDASARKAAAWAAAGKQLQDFFADSSYGDVICSGNVLVGHSIREIHEQTFRQDTCRRECHNLLNPGFHEFGMGTYKDPKTGLLYLCQLFGRGRLSN